MNSKTKTYTLDPEIKKEGDGIIWARCCHRCLLGPRWNLQIIEITLLGHLKSVSCLFSQGLLCITEICRTHFKPVIVPHYINGKLEEMEVMIGNVKVVVVLVGLLTWW